MAKSIGKATGMACEAFPNETGSAVIHDHTAAIARATPLFPVIDVAPLAEIPLAVRTMQEAAHAPDTATSHVPNAALNH